MKKRLVLVLVFVFVLMITGCGNSNIVEEPNGADGQMTENIEQTDTEENISTESVADYPAAIMVNDIIYLLESVPMSAEVDESAIIGYTESYTDTFPENNGETNFNRELGMPYAQVEGGIAVLYNNEWYLGISDSNMADEDTITFIGTIIENTIDSLIPIICVKPMDEEVIPYKAVFFELPDDEAEWASQIGSDAIITCADTFTEQAPYFGTLISIVGWKSENVTKEDGIYVYNEDSQISEIALSFSLKNISPTGATLVFEQYDADAPKGELMYGEEYVIEVKKNGKWEKVTTVIESYGFNAVAMVIKSGDTVERELDWEWLYGELEPGEYRIGKSVDDFIESGNFDKYMVYAHFILN